MVGRMINFKVNPRKQILANSPPPHTLRASTRGQRASPSTTQNFFFSSVFPSYLAFFFLLIFFNEKLVNSVI